MKTGTVEEKDDSTKLADLEKTVQMLVKQLAQKEQDPNTKVSEPVSGFSADQMAQLIRAAKGNNTDNDQYRFDKEYVLGPDDYDEIGVLFTAPSVGIVIIDDIRNGVAMRTPNRKEIFFKFEGQVQSRDERGKVVLNTFSCYLSRSKAEQKWLREHTLYGLMFNESGKNSLSMDTIRMQKLQAYVLGVSNLDNAALFARCKSNGLLVSNDVPAMRLALAEKQLKDYEATNENASQRMTREKHEQEVFLKNTNAMTRP